MEVFTCKQNSICFCDDVQYIHNRREITNNGELKSFKRVACPHYWRSCPHCFSFTPDGLLVCHHDNK